ncbi:MAG: GGDEF domain-containing protein [Candidatus Omnitrophica bacterium]|nr:GGDEF domain-containing protein [Candidatus Omnitrophota bacterium]
MLEQMQRDELTGAYLRSSLGPFLRHLLTDAKTKNRIFSVVLMDVDRFKKFNDKFSHSFGDLILKYLASTLHLSLQPIEDNVFRYGGDEFVVVFPDKEPEEVYKSLQHFDYILANRPFLYNNRLFRISVSCGIASFPSDGQEIEVLIEKSDKAMYFSKRQGHGLITHVGKIPYIKMRKSIAIAMSVLAILLASCILYSFFFGPYVESIRNKLSKIKIITGPRNVDEVILKNGRRFEGYIVDETDDEIIMNLYMDQGRGRVIFKKPEIKSINRAKK